MYNKILSALFLGVLLTGAGCTFFPSRENAARSQRPIMPAAPERDVPASPETSPEGNEVREPLAEGEIGFTINPPESWGEFSIVLHKSPVPPDPVMGDDWEYQGAFSGKSAVTYRGTHPDHVIARGAYAGDVLGYEKKADGYYMTYGENNPSHKVPANLLIGEVPLTNGMALLLKGPEVSDGPSIFPQAGQLVAYINTPNGPIPGGVFIADTEGGVTVEDMKAMLATITIK